MTNPRYSSTFRIGVAAVMFFLCYAGLMTALVQHWSTNALASYGFAVPFISGYIVWTKWRELKELRPVPDYLWGSILTIAGIAMLMVGQVGALMTVQGVSLIVTLAGLVLLVGGRDVFQVLRFPIAYLVLMLPLWGFLINRFQAPSQALAATIATSLLTAIGLPALHHGTTIVLPAVTLEVLPECSGINQLIALTTMALPAAYLWLNTRATRLALLVVAVLVGYLSNGARIAILGLLMTKGFNVSDPHALVHLLPGFVTAAFAYLVLWGCLSYFANRPTSEREHSKSAAASPGLRRVITRRVWIETAVLGVMLFAAVSQLRAVPMDVRRDEALRSVPTQIADWMIESNPGLAPSKFSGFDVDLLRVHSTTTGQRPFVSADDELLRDYRNPNGKRIQLYVAYYGSQTEGKELTGIASRALQKVASTVSVDSGTETYDVQEVIERENGKERGIVFWYDVNGRVVPNIYLAKCYTLWNGLTRRRTNGAVVMIAWESKDGLGSERREALGFARALLPVLRGHLAS